MRNPYEVLGIDKDASIEEIKIAYKRMVRKYHPDQYANNPLSDLAEEKLKEINEAYDFLMKNKNSSYKSYNDGWNNNHYNNTSSNFSYIRDLISRGDLIQAEQLLNDKSDESAEWYFLKGVVFLRKGWHDQAVNHINRAVQMDPNNREYRTVLNNLSFRNTAYREYGHTRGYRRDPSTCELCQCLICSDCCCECMGGDLIECC